MDKFIGVVMGFIFGCIGLSVLVFLWSQPFGQFGSPPLFFRVFGSFIALAFVTVGFGSAVKAITGVYPELPGSHHGRAGRLDINQPRGRAERWSCPNCGASLTEDNEISPSGDVKCLHCESWYNVNF